MKIKSLKQFVLIAFAGLLTGCYYQGPEYYEELDIVYTNYDKSFDFKSHKTYSMPDRIIKVTGEAVEGNLPEYVAPATAAIALEQIKANMLSLGYTYVTDTAAAELILFPAALEVTNVAYYYNYYYYYWGWYYPYYGGWYYPYGTTTTTYQTGTLFLDLTSKHDLSPTGKARAVWIAAINGLLEGTTNEVNQRVVKGLNQAFKQSEYLR